MVKCTNNPINCSCYICKDNLEFLYSGKQVCTGWRMSCPCIDCSDYRDYDLGFSKEEVDNAKSFIGTWIGR